MFFGNIFHFHVVNLISLAGCSDTFKINYIALVYICDCDHLLCICDQHIKRCKFLRNYVIVIRHAFLYMSLYMLQDT